MNSPYNNNDGTDENIHDIDKDTNNKKHTRVDKLKEQKQKLQDLAKPNSDDAPEELQLDEEEAKQYESKLQSRIMNVSTILSIAAMIGFFIWGYNEGIFKSEESLTNFVTGLGFWGPFVFVIIQIVQVVIPIIPGALGCAVGVIVFGPIWGLVYNYIGICLGSLAVFIISRKYGKPIVVRMIGQKLYNKYIGWTKDSRRFEKLFALLIFLPVAPDDALCYIAGLTHMKFNKYALIILLCKPFSISLYSLGLTAVMGKMWEWIAVLF